MSTTPRHNIYLTGFSYSGKSTVARIVASRLAMEYVDIDELIETEQSRTIAEIFAAEGESVFRETESRVLREVAWRKGVVAATGGGIIMDPENRKIMQRTGAVVCLETQPAIIVERMRTEAGDNAGNERPLLASTDTLAHVTALKASRQPVYAICDWAVNTDSLTTQDVATEVARGAEAGWRRVGAAQLLEAGAHGTDPNVAFTVRTGTASYPIVVAPGALKTLGRRMSERGLTGRACVITDSGIPDYLREMALGNLTETGFDPVLLEIPAGEPSKNLTRANELFAELSAYRIERRDNIVALGGGVVGDLAGFVASTYLRGVAFVQVPTTLLAMVDASIGGKVAIDLPTGKNLVGSFYQPRLVVSDTRALDSLPHRDLTAGWAEVIKTAAILDKDLFDYLKDNAQAILNGDEDMRTHSVLRCSAIKGRVVSLDERETTGLRARLNLGHTLGHALENALGYERLLHGEAVAMGMSFAAHVAERVGALTSEERRQQIALLRAYGLPTTAPSNIDSDDIHAALAVDKKVAEGQTRWILCDGIGRGRLRSDVPPEVSNDVLAAFLAGELPEE